MTVDEPIHILRPTRMVFWSAYLLAALLILLVLALSMLGMTIPDAGIWAAAGLAIILILSVEYNRLRSIYKITPSQIVVEIGILARRRRSVFLNNIADLHVQQDSFQRLFGWGVVVVGSSSGRDTAELYLYTKKPRELVQVIEKLIHEYAAGKH